MHADVLENVNPDLSDSEFLDQEVTNDPQTPGYANSEVGDMPTPGAEADEHEGEEEAEEGDIDEDLAAELDLALGDGDEGDEGDDEEDEDEESEEEDEDDEDDDAVQAKKLLNEEIRDLEAAVGKKNSEIASSANPLIRVRGICYYYSHMILIYLLQRRFEDALRKLQADLDMKLAQRDELKEKRRLEKEGVTAEDVGAGSGDDEGEGGDGMDQEDLFGEDPDSMDMG